MPEFISIIAVEYASESECQNKADHYWICFLGLRLIIRTLAQTQTLHIRTPRLLCKERHTHAHVVPARRDFNTFRIGIANFDRLEQLEPAKKAAQTATT